MTVLFIAQMVSSLECGDLEEGLPCHFCIDSSISVLILKCPKCYK